MERVTFTNTRGLKLVGHFHPASPRSVIIMCHGFLSNKSSRGRFDRFSKTFHTLGYSVLAFDFSGCGESDNDRLTLAKMVDDLRAAISFVQGRGYTRIAFYGHSLGSRVCLTACTPEISTMVLSGASTGPVHYNWDEFFTPEQMQELATHGYITEPNSTGPRKTVIIDKQMLLDFENGTQQDLLTAVTCPILILHGNQGWEEPLLSSITRQGVHWLPTGSRLEIIDGADHSFMNHLPIVERLAVEWYQEHFALKKDK